MTIGYMLVAFAAAALLLFLWRVVARTGSRTGNADPDEQILAVDVEAFRNLTDPTEEQYLRDRLPRGEFRRIQRERVRAAIEYAEGVSHNAGVLLSLGQETRKSPDPAIAQAAGNLVDEALRLRLYSVLAISKLWIRFAFPEAGLRTSGIVDRYQHMTEGAVRLGRLQYPERGGMLTRAL